MITFQGRIRQRRFALYAGLCWLALQAAILLGSVPTYVLFAPDMGETAPKQLTAALPRELSAALYILTLLIVLLILIVALSLNIRRFHDFNLSGWLAVPVFAALILVPEPSLSDYLPNFGELIWYAVLVSVPGSNGTNRYGLCGS